MNGRDAQETHLQGSTSETQSSGEALAMSKLVRPFERFQAKIRRAVLLNDGATLTLRVKVEKRILPETAGMIREIRAISDENELA